MVTFNDCLNFLNFGDRITKVKEILVKYHFHEIDLKTSRGISTFIGNLRAFEKSLIKDGLEKDEIEVMIEILDGRHPLSGQPKQVVGNYLNLKCGWKIHLNAKPRNHKIVYYWLLQNCHYGWKYLAGGEDGKVFTIYVGNWDDTEQFVKIMLEKIGDRISNPEGDILNDDLTVYYKIAARFDAPRTSDFHQYGHHGIPYLKNDMSIIAFDRKEFMRRRSYYIKKFMHRAFNILNKEYGAYFRGSKNQVTRLIINYLNSL